MDPGSDRKSRRTTIQRSASDPNVIFLVFVFTCGFEIYLHHLIFLLGFCQNSNKNKLEVNYAYRDSRLVRNFLGSADTLFHDYELISTIFVPLNWIKSSFFSATSLSKKLLFPHYVFLKMSLKIWVSLIHTFLLTF